MFGNYALKQEQKPDEKYIMTRPLSIKGLTLDEVNTGFFQIDSFPAPPGYTPIRYGDLILSIPDDMFQEHFMKVDTAWTIVTSKTDCPKNTYEDDHAVYLCVSPAGRAVVCTYDGDGRWREAHSYKKHVVVTAYQRVLINKDVCAAMQTALSKSQYKYTMDYIDSLCPIGLCPIAQD